MSELFFGLGQNLSWIQKSGISLRLLVKLPEGSKSLTTLRVAMPTLNGCLILTFCPSLALILRSRHQRQEVRWFRVDRIQALEVLEETFVVDPTFDPKDHFEFAFQHEVGGVPAPVTIWFDPGTSLPCYTVPLLLIEEVKKWKRHCGSQ